MTKSTRSIRLRLILAALFTILLAMTAAGWGLLVLFEYHVERRTVSALHDDVEALIAGMNVAGDGTVQLARHPTNPRYSKPFGGTYWQVMADNVVVQRSRSLWDETLPMPRAELEDTQHQYVVSGPQEQSLIAVQRVILITRAARDIRIRFVAAQDRVDTITTVAAFRGELSLMLTVLGLVLLAAFAIAIAVGLAPLRHLRANLSALRSGITERLEASYPSEIAMLVNDLNALLDERDMDAERKRERAADLAHGLKTPLTAVSGISEELQAHGLGELADELDTYTASMLRHVERELALVRSVHAGPGMPPTKVGPVVGALVRSLERIPGAGTLDWKINVPENLSLRIDPTALTEILGALLDNARKFARSSVTVRASAETKRLAITIADDGPGVAEAQLPTLRQRGQRLDQRKPGSGLGLAIASDIAAAIGGTLTFSNQSKGGFLVTLNLPIDRSSAP